MDACNNKQRKKKQKTNTKLKRRAKRATLLVARIHSVYIMFGYDLVGINNVASLITATAVAVVVVVVVASAAESRCSKTHLAKIVPNENRKTRHKTHYTV